MVASQLIRNTLELKNSLHLVSSSSPEFMQVSVPVQVPVQMPAQGPVHVPAETVVPFDFSKTKDFLKRSAYQTVVVKFGGNAIGNEKVLDSLIDDTIALTQAGIEVIVVHGGGTAVNDALAAVGKKTEKINGLRVTDCQTLTIAVKVFTDINNYIAEKFRQKGASALGFCAKSAVPFETKKMVSKDESGSVINLGWVGEIVEVKANSIERWMSAGWIPIVSPLGVDDAGQFYNINADHAALALATSLEVDGLIFMTDVPGVLKDFQDPTSKIGHVTPQTADTLIAQGTVKGGMLPKIKSCVNAVNSGISRISILNSFEPNALLKGFVAPQEIGTLITGDKYEH
jgi:acetylglutamate kinase